MVYVQAKPLFSKLFVDTKLPWLFGDQIDNKKSKSVVENMVGLYEKHRKARNKES